ncbi:hypothetical protein [Schaalia hyovaginalis]|uniref:hypothetical protein n=1 Tax=Schaalia hyovaginalis TaxID=29316 RepID=UPI0026EAC60E|nr:hypothetical protein [Schaalia hyovaginalis]MCI6557776.1 hypothetical protein [Schaalia hyovaginalis]MDY3666272.1 hypothetical protein [Schaalia hyovaginalis]
MNRQYRIRLDASDRSVLAVCTCGWRDLALNRSAAMKKALEHETNVHPEGRQAYDLARAATRRGQRQ